MAMAAIETTSIESISSIAPTPKLESEGVFQSPQQKQEQTDDSSSHPTATTTADIEAAAAAPAGTSDNEFPISNLAPWRFWTLSLGHVVLILVIFNYLIFTY